MRVCCSRLGDESQITKVARMVIAKKMSVALLEEKVMDSHVPMGDPEERQAERGAVGGSECAGGAAVAGGGAGNEGADPGPEGKREDHDRVWDAGGF